MREPAGLILAGRRSTRMGTPKAELTFGDQTMLERCIDRLSPQFHHLAVNTNIPLATDPPQIKDTMKGHLAGILAGLIWAKVQGADQMVSAAQTNGLAIAATSDGEHGTFGLWSVSLIASLTTFLNDGGRKVPAFFNINTPDDLQQATAWL